MQESYYYQIFLDQKNNLVLPSVQQLLEHSFHSEGIKLAEVSSVFFDGRITFLLRVNIQQGGWRPQRSFWVLQFKKTLKYLIF